jgi:predicted transposase YbfD/YdcC
MPVCCHSAPVEESGCVVARSHTNEITGLRPLLAELDLAGILVTPDALCTQCDTAKFLVTRNQAHYLFGVRPSE